MTIENNPAGVFTWLSQDRRPLRRATDTEMEKKHKLIFLGIFLLILVKATGLEAQNVEVTVNGIRSEKGQIAVGVFLDDHSFRKEQAHLNTVVSKRDISDGTLTFTLSLKPGLYGLSVLDDVNCDGKMEYSKLGIPKEGFGFSDYYHTGFSKPKFDSFKFSVGSDQIRKVTVKLRYF